MMDSSEELQLPQILCKDSSLAANEPLAGTAPRVHVWFLLEYWGTWHYEAFEQSDLSSIVRDWLAAQLKAIPNSRLVFIKQQPKSPAEGFFFYVAVSKDTKPTLHKIHLESYEDLIVLDLTGIITNDIAYKYTESHEKLFLVCTNGKRDVCCARDGGKQHQAMAAIGGKEIWQSSHLGGHRFAPTGVALPYGAYYGRFSPDDSHQLIEDYRHDRLTLPFFRGRTCFTPFEQAAEHFVRSALNLPAIDELQRIASARVNEDQWIVQFRTVADGGVHRVRVFKRDLPTPVYKNSADAEPETVYTYNAEWDAGK